MKVGFVSLVGRPNVGKSTLLNALLDFKIAITSPTPQTTRALIKGIYQDDEAQIIFVDTPGLHKPRSEFGKMLNQKSAEAAKSSEIVLFLQPLNEKIGPGDLQIIGNLPSDKLRAAVITKIDTASPIEVKVREKKLRDLGFEHVFATSAQHQTTLRGLINFIKFHLPSGVPLYSLDDLTDRSVRFMAGEMVREAAINSLHEELPHSLYVEVTDYNESTLDLTIINATIFVERESQKAIVVGKGGTMIKTIGSLARKAISAMLDHPVQLFLVVKVNPNWTKNVKEFTRFED